MELEVNVNEDALAEKVTEAILASILGPQIEKAIKDAVEKALKRDNLYGHPTIVERIVNSAIERAVREYVLENHDKVIKPLVEEHMNEEATRALLGKLFEAWAKQMGLNA